MGANAKSQKPDETQMGRGFTEMKIILDVQRAIEHGLVKSSFVRGISTPEVLRAIPTGHGGRKILARLRL